MKKNEIISYWVKKWLKISDINLVLQKVLGLSKEGLFLIDEVTNIEEIIAIIDNVSTWYPIEYSINEANFYGIDFYVDERCLIPRNDTEVMVFEVLKENFDIFIDVWSWSSAISISIYKNYKWKSDFYWIDIEEKALEVSKINSKKHNSEIKYINSSLLDSFLKEGNGLPFEKNILITANLPYIKNNDFENMDKSVLEYEADSALYWWEKTWFELYEELIEQIFELKEKYKAKKITLFIEIWFDQYDYSMWFLKEKWIKFEYFEDNSKIPRCIKITI
jgi:release factor glutamine methyltransferase